MTGRRVGGVLFLAANFSDSGASLLASVETPR
jgi:hypothetical protein